jgi:hypothetical protein
MRDLGVQDGDVESDGTGGVEGGDGGFAFAMERVGDGTKC